MGAGERLPWKELCGGVVEALRGDDPLEAGLRASLGDAHGEYVIRSDASSVTLLVTRSEITPPAGPSVLDHARAVEAGLGPESPGASPANPRIVRVDTARGGAGMRVSNHSRWDPLAMRHVRSRHGNAVEEAMVSLRDWSIRCAEEAVCREFLSMARDGSLRHVGAGGRGRGDVRMSDGIRWGDVDAAARLIGEPADGLWCMASPVQARCLEGEGGGRKVGVVACKAIGDEGDRRHTALVAARGAVSVATGDMEFTITRPGARPSPGRPDPWQPGPEEDVRLGARFALGAAVDPDRAACVVSGAVEWNTEPRFGCL